MSGLFILWGSVSSINMQITPLTNETFIIILYFVIKLFLGSNLKLKGHLHVIVLSLRTMKQPPFYYRQSIGECRYIHEVM